MRLRSLTVRHWRGLEEVSLADLDPGLNLVLGPNEAGKSRLFQALTFALWESHKGQARHKRELQSWGRAESPWVALELECQGTVYRLEKGYLKGAYARLEGGGQTLADGAAEERLQELLGLGGGSRREAAPEDRGLWRLLWVAQGDSRRAPHEDLNAEPKATLQELVAREIGEVAAGPLGEKVLERARQEAAKYWTAARQAPTLELKQAEDAWAQAKEKLAAAQEKRAAAQQDVDALLGARQRLDSFGPRLEEQSRRLELARQRRDGAGELGQRLAAEKGVQEALRLKAEQAQSSLDSRLRDQEGLAKVEEEAASAEADIERLGAEVAALTARHQALQQAAELALERRDALRREAAEIRRGQERQRLKVKAEEAAQRLVQAREQEARLEELGRELAGLTLSRAQVEALEALDREILELRTRLDAAGVHLKLTALRPLELEGEDGRRQQFGEGESFSRLVTAPEILLIPGVARLELAPGGSLRADLSQVGDRLRDQESRRRDLWAELGVSSLEEARGVWQRSQELRAAQQGPQALFERLAPDGIQALAAEAAAQEVRWRDSGPEPEGQPPRSEDEALLALEAAEAALEQARQQRDAGASALEKARLQVAARQEQRQRAEEQRRVLAARLASLLPIEELEALAAAARQAQGEGLLRHEALQKAYEEAGGPTAQGGFDQAQRALSSLERERVEAHGEVQALEGRLQGRGAEGLYEAWQEAEAEASRLAGEARRTRRRGDAALALLRALEEERRGAQERFAEPVRRRIEPYLRSLFPGSSLLLDEQWHFTGLQTRDLQEDFAALSAGAQEQISLLVRLGLAELLAQGKPLPLVLDDPLVNTDPRRQEAILPILGRAAKDGLQLILFTCHEGRYDALGAHRVYRLPPSRSLG